MLERLFFAKIEFWVVLMLLIIGIAGTLFFGWSVQYKAKGGDRGGKVGDFLLSVAELPEPAVKLFFSVTDPIQPQRIVFEDFSGFVPRDKNFQDQGTLLISSYSAEHEVAIVYLYDLANQKILHRWIPPVEEIFEKTTQYGFLDTKKHYRTQHPLLLEDGDILFTSGYGPLVRINACSELVWAADRPFHHSIERSRDGSLYLPIVITAPQSIEFATHEGHRVAPLQDDGFAEVTMDGEIVRVWSVKDILERHGYFGLLYGVGEYEVDRIHLNDVQPMLETDDYVQAGDVALSIRNLSTVMLYRPSTDEIIWLQIGPWLNQHDVDYEGDGVFTIFGNDMVRREFKKRTPFRGYSTIWKYDQKTGEASEYLPMDNSDIYTATEGRHRVLKNGDAFVEETDQHLLHRVSPDGLRWSYANGIDDNVIGAMHWSRYLTPEEAAFPWLDGLDCGSQQEGQQ